MSVGADPRIGSELAGYRIERLLGRGGMSVVYRAEDTRLRRRVALKLLAPELAEDERFRERFLRESRLAASLDHPNVIPIYEAGEAGGVLFIAMRYVEGSDLKRLLEQEGRLEPARALALLSQVAEALDVAHEQGLIHRDVKPGNVLIASQAGREHVYLSDFGLTKQTGSESGLTETGQFVGTANYVSPEQVERKPAGAASDQYALGCVLYECLAGEPPYRSESLMGVLYGHASAPIPSLHQQRPELPQDIDPVIARALAKNPEQRYPSCRALIAEARSALDLGGEPPPASTFTRKRLVLIAGGALAVAAAAAVPTVLLTRRDGEQAAPFVIEPGSLVRIDPATNSPVASVPGGSVQGIAVGEGAVWSVNRIDGTVLRIDPVALAVTKTTSVRGTPSDVTVGAGAVWVVSSLEGDGRLSEVDPLAGRVRRVHSLGYSDPVAVAAGDGSIWVTANDVAKGGAVLRADPESGDVVAAISLPTRAGPLAAGEGSVWVGPFDSLSAPSTGMWRIDPRTDDVAATIDVQLEVDPGTIAVGEGSVWAAVRSGSVAEIDPATNRVTRTTKLVPAWILDLAAGGGSLWATNGVKPELLRIDPATAEVVARFDLLPRGTSGGLVATGAEGVWVGITG